jgi:TRAP-type C4-dicarboxylate transport system permease small subunit
MGILFRIGDILNEVIKFLAGFLTAVMVVLVLLQVIFRYLLKAPLDWSEETASFAFVWMGLLGASVGLKGDDHPNLDILITRFPQGFQKAATVLINLCILFVLGVMFIYGGKLTLSMRSQLTAALGYSVAYMYAVLPLSALIMAFHMVIKTLKLFTGQARGARTG